MAPRVQKVGYLAADDVAALLVALLDRIVCPSSAPSARAFMQARLALLWSYAPKSVHVVQKRLATTEERPRNG